MPLTKIENYINGELVAPISANYLDNFNPALGEVYSLIPDSDERDVQLAVEAAKRAFPSWKQTSHDERFEILMRLVRLIERDLDVLAEAESVDNGKPVSLAKRVDIPRAAANFRFYATAQMHLSNESYETVNGKLSITLCVNRLAWSVAFRLGIYRFIFSLGKLLRRLRRAVAWSPNLRK